MRRKLRLLALLLLFGALPPLLALAGLSAWLEDESTAREEERLGALSRALSAARDANLQETDRFRLLRRAVERFSAPGALTAETELSLQREFDAIAPRLALVRAFRRGGGGPRREFDAVARDLDPVYAIYADFLRRRDIQWNGPDLTAEESRLVSERIVGPRNAPQPIAFKRTLANPVRHGERDGALFWDLVGERELPDGLVMVFVYDDIYRSSFSSPSLVAREAGALPFPVRTGVVDATRPEGTAPLLREDPELSGRLRPTLGAIDAFRTARHLVALLPEGRVPGALLYALSPRADALPWRDTAVRAARLAALLYLLLFAAALREIHAGRLRPFVPIRAQFVGLFLLSALLPLSGAWLLGMRALRAGHAFDIDSAFAQIRAKIAGIEERAADGRRTHEARCRAILADPRAKSFDAEWLERSYRGYNKARAERFRGMRGGNSASEPLNDFYLYDHALTLVASWWGDSSHRALLSLMRGIAERVIDSVNGETGRAARPAAMGDDLAGALLSMDSGMIEGVVRRRGRIVTVQLFGATSTLLIDAIEDASGRATGAVILVFHEWELERRDAWLETARNGPDVPDGIELLAAQKRRELERFPSANRFCPEVERMVAKASTDNAAVSDLILRGGRPHLAVASPVPGFQDFLVVGLMPRERIDAPWRSRARAVNLLLALSLLVALACALVVSARFVEPIRRFDRALAAVAGGDLAVRLPEAGDDEMADMAQTFNRMVAGLDEKERMSRYVSDFVRSAVKSEEADADGRTGERLEATVLFCDIRSFTTLSETHPPSEIVRMLNEYLDLMTRAIKGSGGVIDRFIGDAVKAVFYPVRGRPRDDAARAVTSALAMRAELSRYNARRREQGRFEIDNGVGVNTGTMVKGTIGNPEVRLDLTVVGREVELAADLEAASKAGRHSRVVISEATREAVAHLVHTEPLEGGARGPIHEVIGPKRAEEYLELLSSPDPDARIRGIQLLRVLGDPAAVEPLCDRLADPDARARHECAVALREFPDHGARILPRLVLALGREAEARVRAALVATAGALAGPSERKALERGLTDPDARVRANAVEALAGAPAAEVVPLLLPLLEDPNNRLRANVCVALFRHGRLEAVDTLQSMIRDGAPLMRASGAWGLGEIVTRGREEGTGPGGAARLVSEALFRKLDEGLDALHGLLADPDPMVARNAARSVARIGNRRSVLRLMEAFSAATDPALRAILLSALEEAGSGAAARGLRDARETREAEG